MPQPRDECDRQCMSDIRRNQPVSGEPQGIEREQHDHAERPRAHGCQSNSDTQDQPRKCREQNLVALHARQGVRRHFETDALQLRLKNERDGSNQENDCEGARGDRIGRTRRSTREPKAEDNRRRPRDASQEESSDDRPVDAPTKSEGRSCHELRGRGKQQISSHRNRRRLPKQQHQYRRHHRSAADAGKTNHNADQKSRGYIERIVGHSCFK